MLVSCPQCKANYQLDATIRNVVLVCHRCGTEFNLDQPQEATPLPVYEEAVLFESIEQPYSNLNNQREASNDKPESYPQQDNANPPDYQEEGKAAAYLSEDHLLPERQSLKLWPWLILVLLCISSLGIWKHQQQWLAQPWLRSLMMNIQLTVAPNPADWGIEQEDLHSQWIDRQDGSRVLFIDGYIKNRLLSNQIPPAIQISFFDMPNSSAIQTRTIVITEPPSLPTIRHTPYIAPAIDQIPVSAGGKRAFTLVIENVPEQARELSMMITNP